MKKEYLIYKLSEEMKEATRIDTELFSKFDVKRGLRNEDGTGVLVGLTRIGNVVGYERVPGGGLKPIPGKLFYRGYDVEDISHAIIKEKRFGFEGVTDRVEILGEIARVRGCLKKGNELDYEKAARLLMDDFRSGKLGRITLEKQE